MHYRTDNEAPLDLHTKISKPEHDEVIKDLQIRLTQ